MKGRHPDFTSMHHSLFSYSQSDRRLTFHLIWPLNGQHKKLWFSLGFLYSFPVMFMKRFLSDFCLNLCLKPESNLWPVNKLYIEIQFTLCWVISLGLWTANIKSYDQARDYVILFTQWFWKVYVRYLFNLYLKQGSNLWPADKLFQEAQFTL